MAEQLPNEQLPNEQPIDENVEAFKEAQRNFEAQLALERQKYSALYKEYVKGSKPSPEGEKEPTPEERKKHIEELAKAVRDNKINGLEQAKALIEYDQYVTDNGGRTIFTFTDGTPSQNDLESAEKVKNLLQYAIETSDGSEEIFQATVASKLKDIK